MFAFFFCKGSREVYTRISRPIPVKGVILPRQNRVHKDARDGRDGERREIDRCARDGKRDAADVGRRKAQRADKDGSSHDEIAALCKIDPVLYDVSNPDRGDRG